AEVEDFRTGRWATGGVDEGAGEVGRVLEVHPAAERDVERLASRGREHRLEGGGRHARGPPGGVRDGRAQPGTRHLMVLPVDAGAALVRDLVDAVDRRRRERLAGRV